MITNEQLHNFITTAIEGGSNYWLHSEDDDCRNISIVRDSDLNVTELKLETNVDDNGWTPHTITAKEIRAALQAMKDDTNKNCNAHLQKLAASALSDPDFDYDANDADLFLQYAVFGEIVFG